MIPFAPEASAEDRYPFWTWTDLLLFISAVFPCFVLAFGILRLLMKTAPHVFANQTVTTLSLQALMYALLMGALYLVIASRYHRGLWEALGWNLAIARPFALLAAGPLLAVGVSALGVLLRAPTVNSEIERLITNRTSLAMLIVFGVLLAPMFEELLFRGFLYPLLERSFGPWLGILFTAIPFALLHGAQYEWAWQQVTLIGVAGAVFGVVRYKTGSTAASALLHASYNATGFAAYVLQHWNTLS